MAGVCCARQTGAAPVKHARKATTTFMARRIYHKHPAGRARAADIKGMQPVLLLLTVAFSIGLALVISQILRGRLALDVAPRAPVLVLLAPRLLFVRPVLAVWSHTRYRAKPR